ncbi:unnamed protein product [Protopolystoma xenopodis]|uniref:Uncharacterized protein n=1 Tax=Protopolystoma xenopodis TaxID=117903 RepID=A0A3S5BKT0_9PLAT|nr:unnamed protein product [Protopolystoma xenopodis]
MQCEEASEGGSRFSNPKPSEQDIRLSLGTESAENVNTTNELYLREKPANIIAASQQVRKKAPGEWYFDRNIFIHSRGKECQSYLNELLQSQMLVQVTTFLFYVNYVSIGLSYRN